MTTTQCHVTTTQSRGSHIVWCDSVITDIWQLHNVMWQLHSHVAAT